ncbi:HEPN domain-containing protein [[Actinomadura] parvosata]|uniref:HEPN domain-containing protein n=1 Tax=[Actinomadura] parvosata TaxID=1955412 RepID=UPI0009AC06CA|nr:HEPN domain-containing protein [Nonomuraea sp. ATCC 55076]
MTVNSAPPPSNPSSTPEDALLRISKADKKTLGLFIEGVGLISRTARPIDELKQQACADRLKLATRFLDSGNKLLKMRPAEYRSAISRFYYAMYHAARAVVYFSHGGDDHESHSKLPTMLPNDFIDAALWGNALKDARNHRNAADYDPYPLNSKSLRLVALDLAAEAPRFLTQSRQYLHSKGCGYL